MSSRLEGSAFWKQKSFSESLVHVGAKEGPLMVAVETKTKRWMADICVSNNQQSRAACSII